jgi:hypothetical protein
VAYSTQFFWPFPSSSCLGGKSKIEPRSIHASNRSDVSEQLWRKQNDYLEPNQVTNPLSLYSDDGIYGEVTYQRSDGAPTVVDSITDGSQVSME